MVWRVYKKKTWIILIGIILTITLADQMSVHLFKNVFHRLRPSHAENLKDIVHIVNGNRGGLYGFVSSHATNTFGLAMFLFALIRRRYKYFWWVFVWAAIVSYSRIYLGKHYPGDIICGAILGLLIGYFTSWLSKKALNYFENRKKGL
ncbi:MAG: phosphatase PAP2 family protein [Hyphomicrobiales bacterium]